MWLASFFVVVSLYPVLVVVLFSLCLVIILPVVLRFNLPGMEDKVRRMAEAMQLPDHSVNGFITAVEVLLDEIKIPKSLSEIGVPLDCVERISTKALKDSAARTNPRSATLAEVQALTQSAIVNAR